MPILELKDVRYSYSPEKVVLRGVNCVFECGTLYALVGKSGAGKSTLLSLMAGLDLPESGQVLFEGTPTGDMDLDEYRRRKAAVIYQDFALFPMLTALENIEYPMELCHVDAKEARQQALALARQQGITVIVITQKSSILRDVDNIMLLADGQIAMFGAREQVLQQLAQRRAGADTTGRTNPQTLPESGVTT